MSFYLEEPCQKDRQLLPENGPFSYPGLTRFYTYKESSLIHAILNATWEPYHNGDVDGESFDRQILVRDLRKKLSFLLRSPIDPSKPKGPTHYDKLLNGCLRERAKKHKDCTLDRLCAILDSDLFLGHVFIEFLSNYFNIDIYILDLKSMDIYTTGGMDDHMYYKARDSIIVGFVKNHYDLIGVKTSKDDYATLFHNESPFIRKIWERKKEIAEMLSSK